jgi:hypothetical protein
VIVPEGAGRVVGTLLAFDDRLAEIFNADERAFKRFADAVNSCKQGLPENVRVFSLLAPTQIEFFPEEYRAVSDSEKDAIDYVYSLLDPGIIAVDAYKSIESHIGEYLYFRTDHHWTALGAYYAYRAFAESAGFAPIELDLYEEIPIPDFIGLLYNMLPSESLLSNPDTLSYYRYKGKLETSQKLIYMPQEGNKLTYRVFMGGDRPAYTVQTSVKNGRTALIVKDSYANALIPWLIPHYETVVVIDPRRKDYQISENIGRFGDVDVIFINYALTATFDDFIDAMDAIE